MKKERIWNGIAIVGMAVALAVVLLLIYHFPKVGKTDNSSTQYADTLFKKDQILDINIKMPKEDWNTLIANAQSEEYSKCDIEVNGKLYPNVGIRAKGNSSLLTVVEESSERFSFMIKFDQYEPGQSLDGLTKLCLNNFLMDKTFMKEYIAYDIFSYMNVSAPLCTYASINLNDKYRGLYLAVEVEDESFLQRNYHEADGKLYKPEPYRLTKDGIIKMLQSSAKSMTKEEQQDMEEQNESGTGNVGGENSGEIAGRIDGEGSDLVYKDDNLNSYNAIWEGAVFDITERDKQNVVNALKHIAKGEQIEHYLDVDQMLRYIAANEIIQNTDSYFGIVCHNYYLYENHGQLCMLPWDYDLSCGGFNLSQSTTEIINKPIDDIMFSGTIENRPLLSASIQTEEDKQLYHTYLQDIIDGYFSSGVFETTVEKISKMIDLYVKSDPTTPHTYEQYRKAVRSMVQYWNKRVESVKLQLDGTIPAKEAERIEGETQLVDASQIDLNDIGIVQTSAFKDMLCTLLGVEEVSADSIKKSIITSYEKNIAMLLITIISAVAAVVWIKKYHAKR